MVPAPAIGKAKGATELALTWLVELCLKISHPKIISKPIISKIKAPATVNDLISTPKSYKILVPRNKYPNIKPPEISVIRSALKCPIFFS